MQGLGILFSAIINKFIYLFLPSMGWVIYFKKGVPQNRGLLLEIINGSNDKIDGMNNNKVHMV